jgi:hypothetical protein
LSCVEIEGGKGGYFLQKKINKKDVEMGEGERRVERHVIN